MLSGPNAYGLSVAVIVCTDPGIWCHSPSPPCPGGTWSVTQIWNVTGSDPLIVTVPLMPTLPSKQLSTLMNVTVPVPVVARVGPAAGPTRARVVMAATASQPKRRKMAARCRAREAVGVFIDMVPERCGRESRG